MTCLGFVSWNSQLIEISRFPETLFDTVNRQLHIQSLQAFETDERITASRCH